MTDTTPFDHWANARSSMQRFERSAMKVSGAGLAGAAWLAVAVMLLVALGILLNINMTRMRESFGWTYHADAILLEVSGLQQSMFLAESSVRAFALTREQANLAALRKAKADMEAHHKALQALTRDNPEQLRNLDRLAALILARLTRFDWFAGLDREQMARQIAASTPADLASRARQRQIAADIAAGLAAFRAAEASLLTNRRAFAERDAAILNYLVLALAVLAPVCGFAGFYLFFREHHRRRARELQIELIHTQRLALMGETASMLAHEVNQPLAAATNYLSVLNRLASARETRPEKLKEAAQNAANQVGRAVSIVQRLRSFIEKRDVERSLESPALLINDVAALYGTLGSAVRLKIRVAPGLPNLLIDPVQIQQVFVNLMRNALEAMQDSARRELELDADADRHGAVLFRLRDTGPGLAKDVEAKLFRPFVSTKADGMGVGLSICQKIVSDHGGRIWAEAAERGGTVFCFTLPGVDEHPAAQAA